MLFLITDASEKGKGASDEAGDEKKKEKGISSKHRRSADAADFRARHYEFSNP